MEPKKGKIIRTVFISEWANPQGGQVYYHDIELDNGDRGQIGSKEKMPTKLNPGNELSYTIEATARGNKIKAVMDQNKPAFFGGAKKTVEPRYQLIGFSYSYSKDLVVGGKLGMQDFHKCADDIFKNMIKMYESIK